MNPDASVGPTTATSPELVVLLDDEGRAIGTAPKATVHTADTPLHLAFSAYVFGSDGHLLLTRRALDKPTFPGVWTNSVCGHPAPGEDLADAVRRRALTELGVTLTGVRLVLPGFAYRAEMGGVVEHERCPVYAAWLAPGERLRLDVSEVHEASWVPWQRGVRAGAVRTAVGVALVGHPAAAPGVAGCGPPALARGGPRPASPGSSLGPALPPSPSPSPASRVAQTVKVSPVRRSHSSHNPRATSRSCEAELDDTGRGVPCSSPVPPGPT